MPPSASFILALFTKEPPVHHAFKNWLNLGKWIAFLAFDFNGAAESWQFLSDMPSHSFLCHYGVCLAGLLLLPTVRQNRVHNKLNQLIIGLLQCFDDFRAFPV